MSSLYKRKLKNRTVWYVNLKLANGKRKSINTGCETKTAAKDVAAEFERKILLGLDPLPKNSARGLLLNDVSAEYLRDRREAWGPRTSVLHEHSLMLLQREIGNLSVVEIGEQQVAAYTAAIRTGRSPATVNIDLRNLKAFLRWCKSQYKLTNWDPPRIRQLRPPERQHRDFYTISEAEALVRAATAIEINGESFGRYIAMLLLTGMRMREALGLRWANISQVAGVLTLSGTKSARPESLPITRELSALFNSWQERPEARPLFGFSAWSGHITTCWRRSVQNAGIRPLKLHNCRDTYAVNLLLEGIPLAVVSRLLRHSSITVTMQNYAGFSTEDLGHALENEKPRQERGAYFTAILRGLHN